MRIEFSLTERCRIRHRESLSSGENPTSQSLPPGRLYGFGKLHGWVAPQRSDGGLGALDRCAPLLSLPHAPGSSHGEMRWQTERLHATPNGRAKTSARWASWVF